jgi:hypothetical protein
MISMRVCGWRHADDVLDEVRDNREIGARNSDGREGGRRADVLFLVLRHDPIAQQRHLKRLLNIPGEGPERIDLHRCLETVEGVIVSLRGNRLIRVRGRHVAQHRQRRLGSRIGHGEHLTREVRRRRSAWRRFRVRQRIPRSQQPWPYAIGHGRMGPRANIGAHARAGRPEDGKALFSK